MFTKSQKVSNKCMGIGLKTRSTDQKLKQQFVRSPNQKFDKQIQV